MSLAQQADGTRHPWQSTPLEIWVNIFDVAANCAPSSFDGVFAPDDYFLTQTPDFWSERVSDERVKVYNSLSRVSRSWRSTTLPKLYERIHISKLPNLIALGRALKESCTDDRPLGYGEWTRQLSWRFSPVKGGQYPKPTIEAMTLVMRHTPKLYAFSPSLQMGSTNVPTEVWDALLSNPTPLPLKNLRSMGDADLADIVNFLRHTPNIVSITLGSPWNALGRQGIPLPHLRSLHVDCNQNLVHHIPEFTQSELPCLEEISILFRHHHYVSHAEQLVQTHGKKLKFLQLKMSKAYFQAPPNLASFVDHCPNLTHLIVNARWLGQGLECIERNTKLVRLGLTGYRDIFRITPTCPAPLPAVKFPKSLESVSLLDVGSRRGKRQDLARIRNHLQEWQGKIRIDDDAGLF